MLADLIIYIPKVVLLIDIDLFILFRLCTDLV